MKHSDYIARQNALISDNAVASTLWAMLRIFESFKYVKNNKAFLFRQQWKWQIVAGRN